MTPEERLYQHGFEVIVQTKRGRLCAYVPPCESLRLMIENLQEDDPVWQKPRIRIMRKERIRQFDRHRLDRPAIKFEKSPFV